MANDNGSLSHTKWNWKYHIVFAPKYSVGLQYILDKHKKGKRDRVSYAKVELPHNNFTKGDHIPHEQEYNTRHGVSAIADEVCREIRR